MLDYTLFVRKSSDSAKKFVSGGYSKFVCARVKSPPPHKHRIEIGKVNTCAQCAAMRNIRFWCGFLLQIRNSLSFTQKVRDFSPASASRSVIDWITTFLCGSNQNKIWFFSRLFPTDTASHVCWIADISYEKVKLALIHAKYAITYRVWYLASANLDDRGQKFSTGPVAHFALTTVRHVNEGFSVSLYWSYLWTTSELQSLRMCTNVWVLV